MSGRWCVCAFIKGKTPGNIVVERSRTNHRNQIPQLHMPAMSQVSTVVWPCMEI